MFLVLHSRDHRHHHQIVRDGCRPEEMPSNTSNPQFGTSINQISFLMGEISDIRDMHERLGAGGATNSFPANHGIAWSIYCHDPEGNNLEFFMDTEWYFPQPYLIPLDLTKSDEELYELTRSEEHTSELQ